MFIAVLFTTNKTWKPPNWPLTDEWLEDVAHIGLAKKLIRVFPQDAMEKPK